MSSLDRVRLGALLATACGDAPPSGAGGGRDTARARPAGQPVIFVGLDGADWQLLDDYMAAGVMPNLAQLVREGTGGMLETIRPPLSPLIWTTMMTGVSPLDHGILDFVQFNPATGARSRSPAACGARRRSGTWRRRRASGRARSACGRPIRPKRSTALIVSDRLFTFLFKESDAAGRRRLSRRRWSRGRATRSRAQDEPVYERAARRICRG